jgi:outer membrane receptor protein involved in Fe transport
MKFNLPHIVFLLAVLIIASLESNGQNRILKGQILDSRTLEPITNVKVKIQGISASSLTDRKGFYSIEIPENHPKIEFVDFANRKISKTEEISGDQINIYLSEFTIEEIYNLTLEELMHIKVSVVSKATEAINEAPGVVSVVSAKEIESFGASSLRDVLERVTSVVGLTEFNNRNVISMRGDQISVANEHILLTINGRPSREVIKGGADSDIYAMFPLNSIKQIEVIRGPGSVLYGTNAFTGVINIVTKDTEEHLSSSFEVGAPWAKIASVSGGSKIGKGMFSAAIQYKKLADWTQSFTTELDVDTSFTTNEEGFGAHLSYHQGGFSANSSLISWNTFLVAPHFGGNTGNYSRQFVDLGYVFNFNEKIKSTINTTYTHCYFDGTPLHTIRNSNDFITEIITYYNPINNLNIVAGGLVNHRSGIAKRQNELGDIVESMPWYTKTWYSFYSQADYQYKSLKVLAGFQAHKHLKDKPFKFIPRLGLLWNPTEQWLVKTLYAEAYRAPIANETNLNDPRLIGNPRLGAEFVKTYDFELSYRGKKIHSSFVLFNSQQDKIIGRDPNIDPSSFINYGDFETKGIEFEGKYLPNANIYILGSMSYQTNALHGRHEIRDFTTAPFTAKLGFSYTSPYGLSFGVFNIYNSTPPDVILRFPERNIVNPVPHAFNLLSANIRLDISQLFKIRNDITFNIRGENLLNEEIYTAEWVRSRINSIPGKPGRRIYFGVQFDF